MTDYVVLFTRGNAAHYETVTARDEETARDKVYGMCGGDINVVDCWQDGDDGYVEFKGGS